VLNVVGGGLPGVQGLVAQLLTAFSQCVDAAVTECAGVMGQLLQGRVGLVTGHSQAIQALLGKVLGGSNGVFGTKHGLLGQMGDLVANVFERGVH
jgi:hypothetical protein